MGFTATPEMTQFWNRHKQLMDEVYEFDKATNFSGEWTDEIRAKWDESDRLLAEWQRLFEADPRYDPEATGGS